MHYCIVCARYCCGAAIIYGNVNLSEISSRNKDIGESFYVIAESTINNDLANFPMVLA